ncbi:hypothetical protein BD309DRAFT_948700 [Dichomitus squalens]|nr:hypothetical protein BD309DRAFT_948700 [Dichomitus squalens]
MCTCVCVPTRACVCVCMTVLDPFVLAAVSLPGAVRFMPSSSARVTDSRKPSPISKSKP